MQNGTPRSKSPDSFPRSTSVSLKVGVDGDGLEEQQLVRDHQQPHPRHKTNKVLVRGPSRCVNHVHILWGSSLHLLGRVKTSLFFFFFLFFINPRSYSLRCTLRFETVSAECRVSEWAPPDDEQPALASTSATLIIYWLY